MQPPQQYEEDTPCMLKSFRKLKASDGSRLSSVAEKRWSAPHYLRRTPDPASGLALLDLSSGAPTAR